ncbi:hypothetical protein ATG98_3507 [Marinobacter sp. LV10R520-4]|uniref:hypothetical protein n=1 Tax=Marinobacter sp. LV10R520-4 TaxID=1761796 RepID=UPI000BF71D94|nr:hypothetical protein [Marinobacter sp. LV10R520-4]PFG54287.1 hypothetical protein ATG98_3507 [Marinobacter sp. LV10R520-4]
MNNIHELAKKVIDAAECSDQFHEVELTILIRTHDGQRSDFIRLQSERNLEPINNKKRSKSDHHIEF